jgi:hypothetical protein
MALISQAEVEPLISMTGNHLLVIFCSAVFFLAFVARLCCPSWTPAAGPGFTRRHAEGPSPGPVDNRPPLVHVA